MLLLDALTTEDRVKIFNYITSYGAAEQNFIGIDEYLYEWAKNKKKLYHLLGDKFIVKVPFSYEKPENELRRDLYNLKPLSWINRVIDYVKAEIKGGRLENVTANSDFELDKFLCHLLILESNLYIGNKIGHTIKVKTVGGKKILNLDANTKPMKALLAVLKYFNLDEQYKKEYEELRISHSLFLNDRLIKGNMCFSIHPLDFMTMSDNASGWQSCMSWTDNGCYRIGTVEMMNSNNVVCCYIESSTPYDFARQCQVDKDSEEQNIWDNKKWRCLAYVTPEMIVSGKSYPYYVKELSCKLVEILQKLAGDNLHWGYQFSTPEPYKDMVHITGRYSMDRSKRYAHNKSSFKQNIIFDSKGMYNDMLNDNYFGYWCVRNKVPYTKVISYSGKASCLCCGDSVVTYIDCTDEYNDRYDNTGALVCKDCALNFSCEDCGSQSAISPTVIIEGERLCLKCASKRYMKCICCGRIEKNFVNRLRDSYDHSVPYVWAIDDYKDSINEEGFIYAVYSQFKHSSYKMVPVCSDCLAYFAARGWVRTLQVRDQRIFNFDPERQSKKYTVVVSRLGDADETTKFFNDKYLIDKEDYYKFLKDMSLSGVVNEKKDFDKLREDFYNQNPELFKSTFSENINLYRVNKKLDESDATFSDVKDFYISLTNTEEI